MKTVLMRLSYKRNYGNQAQWLLPVIPSLESPRQDNYKLEASLGAQRVSGQPGLHNKTLFQKKKTNQRNKQQIVASVLTVVSVLDLFGIMGSGEVSCYEEQPRGQAV